jgi:hypothetical protein
MQVFGFCFEESHRKAQQEFITVPETSLGKVRCIQSQGYLV